MAHSVGGMVSRCALNYLSDPTWLGEPADIELYFEQDRRGFYLSTDPLPAISWVLGTPTWALRAARSSVAAAVTAAAAACCCSAACVCSSAAATSLPACAPGAAGRGAGRRPRRRRRTMTPRREIDL